MARFLRPVSFALSILFASLLTSVSLADDSGTPQVTTTTLDLWLNSAPAELLIGEIAEITRLKADIEGDLKATVSGRYTGSVRNILDAVAREHPVLFDLDDSTISAVPEAQRTVSSIVADEASLNAVVRDSITAELLSGNSIEFTDKEIVVTGHPRFVSRTARQLSSALADQGRLRNTADEPAEQKNLDGSAQTSLGTITAIDKAQPVTDAAAAVVLSDIEQAVDEVPVDAQATVAVSGVSAMENSMTVTDVTGGTQTTLTKEGSAVEPPEADQGEEGPDARLANAYGSEIEVPADDESFGTETARAEPSRAPAEVDSTPRVYRWVTDIPGFDTF